MAAVESFRRGGLLETPLLLSTEARATVGRKIILTTQCSISLNGGPKNSLSDAELMADIGKELRAVYIDVLREPLPDKVATLSRKLDERNG